MKTKLAVLLVLLAATIACKGSAAPATEATGASTNTAEATGAAAAEATGAAAEATGAAAEATGAAAEATGAAAVAAPAADTFENGLYTSPRFNVRLNLPEGWSRVENAAGDTGGPAGLGTSDDSVTFVGPAESGLRLVLANTDSIQLVDASFNNLTESIGFENVRIHPDRTQTRTFNGVPGYRTEADALLRGDAVPVYLIAQALELPGKPTMATIFVPGDLYHIHSATMIAILDSIQAINLRGN